MSVPTPDGMSTEQHPLLTGWQGAPEYFRFQEHHEFRPEAHYPGSPCPLEHLDGIETMSFDVHPGDVYLFNGSHVHAVEPGTDPSVRNITLSGLLGFVDDRTVVSWT
jgi:hypothetical protein